MNDVIIQQSEALKPHFENLQKRSLLVGLLGIFATVLGYLVSYYFAIDVDFQKGFQKVADLRSHWLTSGRSAAVGIVNGTRCSVKRAISIGSWSLVRASQANR